MAYLQLRAVGHEGVGRECIVGRSDPGVARDIEAKAAKLAAHGRAALRNAAADGMWIIVIIPDVSHLHRQHQACLLAMLDLLLRIHTPSRHTPVDTAF